MMMAGHFHPPFSFCTAAKRERAVDGPREKTPRRVGLRKRSPPAAGGGWLAVPRGSQRRKRAALGVTFGLGRSGIHPAPLFAAAGPVVDESLRNGPMRASAPMTARAAHSEAERAEREAGQMRSCNPIFVGTRAAGIRCQVRTAPRRARRNAISNTQAPPHADPRTATLHVRAKLRPNASFSSTGRGAFSFWARPKREWGAHPCGNSPLREQTPRQRGCLTASP